jgi:hypothetical protein
MAKAGIQACGWIELQTAAKKIARIEPNSGQNLVQNKHEPKIDQFV